MFRYILLERNIDSVQLIFDNCSAFCFFRFVFARPSKSVRIETVKKFDANWIYVKRNLKMFRQDYLPFYRNYFDLPVNMLTINPYWILSRLSICSNKQSQLVLTTIISLLNSIFNKAA